ncbi:MAG: hypothetical protein K8S27_06045 [Candidatus Omnitrophica bacterium]|nr:hypothetical protein [Candidatus Omnitrophota bacterium]
MWIEKNKNSNKFNVTELQQLLSYHQQTEWNALDRFAQHQNILAGGLLAILGAGGASLGSSVNTLHYSPFFLPLFVVFLRRISIETLDRYYQRFLEAVVCTAKIAFLLGLNHKVWSDYLSDENLNENNCPFHKDETLGIDRHWKATTQKGSIKQSEEWIIEFMSKGHNSITWKLFSGIYFGSLVFPFMAVFRIGQSNLTWLYAFVSFVLSLVLYYWDSGKIRKKRKNRI